MSRTARLNEEKTMSIDTCRTCKYVGYCTFPKSRTITECDEYEDLASAPEQEWDLQQLLKLWTEADKAGDERNR